MSTSSRQPGARTAKCLAVLVGCLLVGIVSDAQTPEGQAFAWDYPDATVAELNIVRFELRFDGRPPVSVGMWPLPGVPGSYFTPLREMPSGQHAVEVRACSPSSCFGWSAPMLFLVSPFFQVVEVGSFGVPLGAVPDS